MMDYQIISTNEFVGVSPTSLKHEQFVSGPMGDKLVTVVPGIGPVLGCRLSANGYDTAYALLGQYLIMKKNNELFMEWLKNQSGANRRYAGQCANALMPTSSETQDQHNIFSSEPLALNMKFPTRE